MLSIAKLGAGKERYYLNSVARGRDDYYTGDGEAPGRWLGQGAKRLGLKGTVKPDDFTAVVAGRTRKGVSLRSHTSPVRVDAFDLTFSAPKSVSLLYGVGDPRVSRITREAHDDAVKEALGYLEREACKVRRGLGGRTVLPATGVVAAAFRHRSSRAGDPQLHTHTVVANAGYADGKWSALYGRVLYAHAKTAGCLYQAALRDHLTRELGVTWEPVHNGMAEINGVAPDVLRHFSQRSHELEEHLNETGRSGRRARELAALDTRRRKDYAVTPDRLHQDWRARAAEQGFGLDEIASLLGRAPSPAFSTRELIEAADRLAGPGGVTRSASTFDRRDVLRDWAEQHRGGAPVDHIERLADVWLSTSVAVPLPPRAATPTGGRRYSTREMLATERELIDASHRRRGAGVAQAAPDDVERAIRDRPSLTREQAIVVRGLTRSGDGVQVLRAAAGTGKTFALDAAREAWEASDIHVVGCALSARAAVELQSQSAITSDTVARLQRRLSQGHGIPPRGVLVVDEAGMVGSRQLAELAAAAERVQAKLVLVGDDHQLPEIDAGGALRGIAKQIGSLQLRTVLRQEHHWDREALDHLRHGRVEEWAKTYREHGRLVSHPTAEQSRGALVSDWWGAAREDGTDTIMIAHRRSDVADLNRRARSLMLADRRLGADELTVHDRSFAVGDRVLAKRNDRRLDIVNGSRGVVSEVDLERRAVSVDVIGHGTVKLDARYLDAGFLDHGYALTAHAAQGITVDKSFVLGSDDLYREWGYTALSRHRVEARYYTVSVGRPEATLPGLEPEPDPLLRDIVEALQPSRQKELALDAAGGAVPVDEASRPRGAFADLRAAQRDARRLRAEAERIEGLARDAVMRRGELQQELDATPRRRIAARAQLREAIGRQDDVIGEWSTRDADLRSALEESEAHHAALLDDLGPLEPAAPSDDITDLDAVLAAPSPADDLCDGLDFGP